METAEEKKVRRYFNAEQRYQILKDIEACGTVKEGLEKCDLQYSVYRRWKRQLEVGVRQSLRTGRPAKDPEQRRLAAENRRLKEIVLNQSAMISDLKKEMGLD
ncbi:MAG: transposase [Candidatus Omnitrophota bacterium]|nr:transposase [Candidatus Omnitrophota bacterium]